MDPLTISAIVGASGSIASSAGGFLSSLFTNKMRYKAANRLLDKQLNWSERMSNTAHQREVADLRAAGLNPVLSAMGGSGATTPSAGTANMPDIENPMNSALAWRQQRNENKLADTQADLNSASAFKNRKDASLAGEMARNEAEKYDVLQLQKEQIAQDIKNSIELTKSQVYSNVHSANAAMESAKTKPISAYLGKWIEDKFQSTAGSTFGKDVARLGRMIYRR